MGVKASGTIRPGKDNRYRDWKFWQVTVAGQERVDQEAWNTGSGVGLLTLVCSMLLKFIENLAQD